MLSRETLEDFIYGEARLLDEKRYQEWLDLFTEDCVYWIPSWINETQPTTDPKRELSILYLERKSLDTYIKRILTGEAHTYTPSSRTARFITNLTPVEVKPDGARVLCNWQLHTYATRVPTSFYGDAEYRIVEIGGKPKISYKRVTIINDDIKAGQLIII